MSNLDFQLIESEIAAGYINQQQHPALPYRILNYSASCQYEWRWNPATMACRGLIVGPQNQIIARPFPKFFSFEQLNGNTPTGAFRVFEKMDGSLGILYPGEDGPRLATRGSFISEQAAEGTRILREKYPHAAFDPAFTYLFEIIYPKNRIVVDYGAEEALVLLAVIETATGREIELPDIGIPAAKEYTGFDDPKKLGEAERNNAEGFVARFECGTRVKFKFAEYKRLHKVLTGLTPRHLWEMLSSGQDITALLDRVPDEFYAWLREVESGLRAQYSYIEDRMLSQYRDFTDRREAAEYFKSCDYPHLMFSKLSGKDYSQQIWKMIQPSGGAAFRRDEA